jgi:hypothetical protein
MRGELAGRNRLPRGARDRTQRRHGVVGLRGQGHGIVESQLAFLDQNNRRNGRDGLGDRSDAKDLSRFMGAAWPNLIARECVVSDSVDKTLGRSSLQYVR